MADSLLIALAASSWYLTGVTGFIYWWTSEFDFQADDRPKAAFFGLLGPLSWVMGYFIHRPRRALHKQRVLMNRRGQGG